MHAADAGRARPPALQGVIRSEERRSRSPSTEIDRDPDQPREEFDEEALGGWPSRSRRAGQLQPIRVRWDEGRGSLRDRLRRAAVEGRRDGGPGDLSARGRGGPDRAPGAAGLQLVENALREDLKPIEQARAYRPLMDAQRLVGAPARRGSWPSTTPSVVRALALLDLPEAVQERVEQGTLRPGDRLRDRQAGGPPEQPQVAEAVVTQGLTRQEAANVVRQVKAGGAPGTTASGRVGSFEYKISPKTTVTVRFKGEERLSTVQALKAASRAQVQESAAADQTAA